MTADPVYIHVCEEIGNDEMGDGVKVPFYSLAKALRTYPESEHRLMVRSGPTCEYKKPSASELLKARTIIKK